MFSTDFFRQQENLVDNQKCQAGFRRLSNKILLLKRVDNTQFNTNLTVHGVCTDYRVGIQCRCFLRIISAKFDRPSCGLYNFLDLNLTPSHEHNKNKKNTADVDCCFFGLLSL